jgi:hypothetical protein
MLQCLSERRGVAGLRQEGAAAAFRLPKIPVREIVPGPVSREPEAEPDGAKRPESDTTASFVNLPDSWRCYSVGHRVLTNRARARLRDRESSRL